MEIIALYENVDSVELSDDTKYEQKMALVQAKYLAYRKNNLD